MDSGTNALLPGMVETYSGFWPWRLLCRRWPLQTHWPLVGQRSFGAGKPDIPKCQTRPSGFLGGNNNTWLPAGVEGTQ
jgi:hypothetical protein